MNEKFEAQKVDPEALSVEALEMIKEQSGEAMASERARDQIERYQKVITDMRSAIDEDGDVAIEEWKNQIDYFESEIESLNTFLATLEIET